MPDQFSRDTKIAVVIPVFQAQTDFEDTLRSLETSDTACDVIVVDDGSTPPLRTVNVNGPLRVHLIRLPKNQGIVGALNAGLRHCLESGYEFIARIDAGDFARCDRLSKQVAYFEQHPGCMLVGTDAEVRDESGEYQFTIEPPRSPRKLAAALHERSWLLHPSVMFRAAVFETIDLYSDQFPAAEDYEMFLRIATRFEVGVIPEPLLTYIVRKNGISGQKTREQARSRLAVQLRHFRWGQWMSYYGLMRSLGVLAIPLSFKNQLKHRFLYANREAS